MAEQRIKYAFRLVHIDNISHVNRYGFVHKDSKYVVYNADAMNKLLDFGISPEKIVIKQDYYF